MLLGFVRQLRSWILLGRVSFLRLCSAFGCVCFIALTVRDDLRFTALTTLFGLQRANFLDTYKTCDSWDSDLGHFHLARQHTRTE